MDRTNGAGNVGRLFVAEDIATNRPPTEVTAEWLNAVQEEIAHAIEASGAVLDPADRTQLYTAMLALIAAHSPAPVFQTLVDGVNIAWNAVNGISAQVTLAGNRTISAPTGLAVGTYMLIVKQDAVGNRTLAWNAAFKWPGGVLPVLSTAANGVDIFSFFCDGVTLYGSYARGMA